MRRRSGRASTEGQCSDDLSCEVVLFDVMPIGRFDCASAACRSGRTHTPRPIAALLMSRRIFLFKNLLSPEARRYRVALISQKQGSWTVADKLKTLCRLLKLFMSSCVQFCYVTPASGSHAERICIRKDLHLGSLQRSHRVGIVEPDMLVKLLRQTGPKVVAREFALGTGRSHRVPAPDAACIRLHKSRLRKPNMKRASWVACYNCYWEAPAGWP